MSDVKTSEAAVTVEQCDRECAADILAMRADPWEKEMRHGRLDQRQMVERIARHRLAALASAPAGEVCSTCGQDNTALVCSNGFHAPLSASAPAGDGVEEAIKTAIAEGMGEYIMPGAPYDATVVKVLAALARPRAEVGDRKKLRDVVALAVMPECDDEWAAVDNCVAAILSLQASPALDRDQIIAIIAKAIHDYTGGPHTAADYAATAADAILSGEGVKL